MRRLPIAVIVTAVALIALAVVGGLSGSTASSGTAPQVVTAPVTSATLVCPDLNGVPANTSTTMAAADLATALTPPSHSTGTVTATALAGTHSTPRTLTLAPAAVVHSAAKLNQTIALHATGSVAASLVGDQVTETTQGRGRGLFGAGCVAPATDWWFAGADGRVGFSDVLTVANPSPTPADISITMWGEKGPLTTTRLQSLRVGPNSVRHIGIASIAPDVATVAVHVHASSGAVTAALIDLRSTALLSDGGDFMPATSAPTGATVIAGYPGGKGPRRLVLADPGALDATVNLRLVTRSGSFIPAGDNQVVVHAGHTSVVDLDKAFDGTTGAVQLTSDQPVVAEGLARVTDAPHRPDLMWLAATAPLDGSAGIATGREPDGGKCFLLLSAPAAAAVVVLSTPDGKSTTISVPAGRSVAVDLTSTVKESGTSAATSWPFVVTSTGSAPVYGIRMLTFNGAHGALVTGEPLTVLPAPIVLPPVRPDARIAIR